MNKWIDRDESRTRSVTLHMVPTFIQICERIAEKSLENEF